MKNRIVKKILRIILLVLVGAAVIGTFYFLWKKAQPVITVYEIVTPEKGDVETKTVATGNVEPRFEVEIKPQISGIISELKKEAGQMVQAGEIIAIIKVIPEMVQLNSAESRVMSAGVRESSSSSGAGSVSVSTDPSRVMVTCCKSMPKLPS